MKRLKLKWRKGPDRVWRADTNIGASFFIFKNKETGKYELQVNGWGRFLCVSSSRLKCKLRASKFPLRKDVREKFTFDERVTWEEKVGKQGDRAIFQELNDGFIVWQVGWHSSQFPHETRYEQFLRKDWLAPRDKPVIELVKLKDTLYGFRQNEIEARFWREKEDKAETEVYPGKPRELRIPMKGATIFQTVTPGHGKIWSKKQIKNTKWKTIRKWALGLIECGRKSGGGAHSHVTISALRNRLRANEYLSSAEIDKACSRLDLIFAADVERERNETETLIRHRIEFHIAEAKRLQEEKAAKAKVKQVLPVDDEDEPQRKEKKKGKKLSKKMRRKLERKQKRLNDAYMEKKRLRKEKKRGKEKRQSKKSPAVQNAKRAKPRPKHNDRDD